MVGHQQRTRAPLRVRCGASGLGVADVGVQHLTTPQVGTLSSTMIPSAWAAERRKSPATSRHSHSWLERHRIEVRDGDGDVVEALYVCHGVKHHLTESLPLLPVPQRPGQAIARVG